MKKRFFSLAVAVTTLTALMPIFTVRSAASVNIGDYVQMGTYYGAPILWRCVDIDENGPLMLSDKIICLKPFDAITSENSETGSHSRNEDRRLRGSEYWADSNIRSWLNSNADSGEIEWLCGNPPDEDHVKGGYNDYDQEPGFLTNFTQSEVNAIKEVTQKSILLYPEINVGMAVTGTENHIYDNNIPDAVTNYDTAYAEYVTDKIFLIDVKQLNAIYDNRNVLGAEYYYIGEPTEQCAANSEYKTDSLTSGQKWPYWLRSSSVNDSHCYVRYVIPSGYVYNSSAYYGDIGVRPALYLNESAITISGSGTNDNPYTIDDSEEKPAITPMPIIPLEVEKVQPVVNSETNTVAFPVTVVDSSRAEELNEVELYVAEYDADGRFTGLTRGVKSALEGDTITITAGIPESDNYKFMLWDGNNIPLMDAVTNIKE